MLYSFFRASNKWASRVIASVALIGLTGCSVVYNISGRVLDTVGKDVVVPYLLSTEDGKMGCAFGEAMSPLLLAFSEVSISPDELEVLMQAVNGTCASQQATQAELEYLRYSKERRIEQAKDARARAKRWHNLAAKRYLLGYEALKRGLGDPGTCCPKFRNELQELVWVFGAIAGVQAVASDTQSDLSVGVPLNIVANVEEGMRCLDEEYNLNEYWWGVPRAIRAAVWLMLPGNAPEGVSPWLEFDQARAIGNAEGVRLASALDALISYNNNEFDRVKDVIRDHAQSLKATPADEEFRMVDAMAKDMMMDISDRLWTEAIGSRTPLGAYGTFWDDKKPELQLDESLLDGF